MTSPPKRILHVYKDYWPPVVGGIEKSIHWLAHGCTDQYEVAILVCSRRAASVTERDGPVSLYKVGEFGRFASAPISPAFPLRLRRLRADILHYHHPNPTGEIAHLLARPAGRVVVTYHSDIVRQRRALKLYGPWLRRFLRRADVLLPTSPNYIESSEFLRPLKDKCVVVPLGIPLEEFAATPQRLDAARRLRERFGGGLVALFVGQFREYKGLIFLLEALGRTPRVTAVLAGEGPCRPELEAATRRLGLEGRVHFPGPPSDTELPDYYHACDVFVLPSHRRSEAFGIVQVEAMACGKPVVSTRLDTGVPFVNRDGETGFTVTPGDPAAIADALQRLDADPDLRRRLGEAARARAQQEFSASLMIDRVKSVYASLLAPDAGPAHADG